MCLIYQSTKRKFLASHQNSPEKYFFNLLLFYNNSSSKEATVFHSYPIHIGAVAYQLGNTSYCIITEVKQC